MHRFRPTFPRMFTAHGCLRLRGVSSCHRIFCLFHCLQHHLCTAERKHARSSACTHVCKRTRTHAYTHICTHSCTLACKRASNQIKRCLQFYTCNFTPAILHLQFYTCTFAPAILHLHRVQAPAWRNGNAFPHSCARADCPIHRRGGEAHN